jgi:hypothetical protein
MSQLVAGTSDSNYFTSNLWMLKDGVWYSLMKLKFFRTADGRLH